MRAVTESGKKDRAYRGESLGMPGRFSEVAERGASSHGAAHDVQQFVGDGLLASFVVHDGEVLYQVVGIVRGYLHGHASCGMFGCVGV